MDPILRARLSKIKNILIILSGKGGVGKSSVTTQLALVLSSLGSKVGILDVDLTGPSMSRMLGMEGQSVLESGSGWLPVERDGIKCMSIAFLLGSSSESVVWRGPKKTSFIHKLLNTTQFEELDYLLIDTPPGTSDEHISLLELLAPLITPTKGLPTLSSILISTPQAIALLDVSKELSFIKRTELPLIGLIENMSGYQCPHCKDIINIFGMDGAKDFCRLQGDDCQYLGRIPIDSRLIALLDGSLAAAEKSLTEQYKEIPSYEILKEICMNGIIPAIEKRRVV